MSTAASGRMRSWHASRAAVRVTCCRVAPTSRFGQVGLSFCRKAHLLQSDFRSSYITDVMRVLVYKLLIHRTHGATSPSYVRRLLAGEFGGSAACSALATGGKVIFTPSRLFCMEKSRTKDTGAHKNGFTAHAYPGRHCASRSRASALRVRAIATPASGCRRGPHHQSALSFSVLDSQASLYKTEQGAAEWQYGPQLPEARGPGGQTCNRCGAGGSRHRSGTLLARRRRPACGARPAGAKTCSGSCLPTHGRWCHFHAPRIFH